MRSFHGAPVGSMARCLLLASKMGANDVMRCPTTINTFHYHAGTREYPMSDICSHKHRTIKAAARCFEQEGEKE